MKKKFLSITLISSILVIGLLFITHISDSKIAAAPLLGQTDIRSATGINKISGDASNIQISGDYGLMFQLTNKVYYEAIGSVPTVDLKAKKSVGYKFTPGVTSVGQGVWVRNAALYNGKAVDMKVVIDELDFKKKNDGSYPSFYFLAIAPEDRTTVDEVNVPDKRASTIWGDYYLYMGSGSNVSALLQETYVVGDKAEYHYEFFDGETGQPIQLKGAWNFNNINEFKKTRIELTQPDYSSMYVLDSADIGYTRINDVFEMSSDSDDMNLPSGRMTQLFDTKKYSVGLTKYSISGTPGSMGLMYSNQSLARIAPSEPIVFGKRNDAVYTSPEYKKMYYSILQNTADNTLLNRSTDFSVTTEVPNYYDIESIEVNAYGTTDRLEGLFSIAINGSKATLTAKDPTSDDFNGKLFDIQVVAKPNASFKFDKTAYGYQAEKLIESGKEIVKGYMNFELGSPTPKTTATYKYKNKKGDVLFSGDLDSAAIKDKSVAKVLYQAIPAADPKENLSAEVGTNIKDTYPDPKSIIENLRLDTEESTDDVTVSYKEKGPINAGTNEGDVTNVIVLLTTKDQIQTEVTVPIKAKNAYGIYTVKFLDEGNDELVKSVDLTQKPIGVPIDLTEEQSVQDKVDELVAKGYLRQPWSDDNAGTEKNYPINDLNGTIIYRFKGTINFQVTKTMPFKQGVVNPAIKQTLPYAGTDDFAISVKDLRSVNSVIGEKRGDFSIQASLTDGFKKDDKSGSSLTNIRLLYNKSGKDADDIEISATDSPIYKGTDGDNSDIVIKLDSGNKTGQSDKKGLRLELDKGNNAGKNVTYEATVTWSLIYGP